LAVSGTLCNEGDRVCGPEPRRAPDNKICFSGIGNYALTNGKRDKDAVVFRVDVEDRSEPGGTNGPLPPDRYRIRIWLLTPTAHHGPLGDPADVNSLAYKLRDRVACADPTKEAFTRPVVGGIADETPDIDDGGDLIRGNQQIHPPHEKECTP
jgi:hypothetical protein